MRVSLDLSQNRRQTPRLHSRPRTTLSRRARLCATTVLTALILATCTTTSSTACGVGESTTMTVTQQPVGGTGGLPFTTQPVVVLSGPGGFVCVNDSTTTIHATLGKNPAVFASLAKASTCSDGLHDNNQTACTAIGGNAWSPASEINSLTWRWSGTSISIDPSG